MKPTILGSFTLLVPCLTQSSSAFQPSLPSSSSSSISVSISKSSSSLFGYVPDGFTKDLYEKFKKAEAKKKQQQQKNLGRMGPKGFQSRSFQSFQEALERGEATHLMPVMNAKEKVKKGILKKEDIPYMQRGGNWDNSDVRGARKSKWLKSDKDYAKGGYKKEQSVSIFGKGEGLDWTGSRGKRGPASPKTKASNKNVANEKPKKKLFGLF